MRTSAPRPARRPVTAAVACAAALLLAACSSGDDAAGTDAAPATAAPSSATAAPDSATAAPSSAPATGDHDHSDHDHTDDDHSDHDHASDDQTDHGHSDHDHDHAPAEIPLDAATVQWYESFCSVVDGVALQSGATYTVQSPPEEIRSAHVEWLNGVETDATTYLNTMKAAGTPGVDDGARLQADLMVTLEDLRVGAGASADLFESGAAIDGVEPTDPAWLEKALAPYTEGVEPFHDYLSANEKAVMPGEHEAQITSIGVCSAVLHVH